MPEARGPPSTPLSGGFGLQPGPPGRQAPTITTLSRGFGLQPGPTARPTAPLAIPPNTERRVSAGARLIVAIRTPYGIALQLPQMQPPMLSKAFTGCNLKLVYTIVRLRREAPSSDDMISSRRFAGHSLAALLFGSVYGAFKRQMTALRRSTDGRARRRRRSE